MNIIDALKSGRPIKRKHWLTNAYISRDKDGVVYHQAKAIGKEDILADDWEVEEKKAEVSEGRLECAIKSCWKYESVDDALIAIKDRLGLRD